MICRLNQESPSPLVEDAFAVPPDDASLHIPRLEVDSLPENIRRFDNSLVLVSISSYSNTGSIRDDPYWTSRENSLELIEIYPV